MIYLYTSGGFCIQGRQGQKFYPLEQDQICVMCGTTVPRVFLPVHRSGCALPHPFDIGEYSRRLGIAFVNVKGSGPGKIETGLDRTP